MDLENKGPDTSDANTETHYLHSSGVAIYNADKRTRQDTPWTVFYCLLAALTVFWGIPAFLHTDPNAGLYTYNFYYKSTSCDVQAYTHAHPVTNDDGEVDPTFMNAFKKSISIWLPITAVLAVLSSSLFLYLFKRFAKAMVKLTIIGSISLGALLTIVCFATGAIPFAIILLISTAITAIFYYLIRKQLALCAELLGMAGRGLNDNLMLIPAAIGIKVAGLCVLIYSFAAFFSAINIGHVESTGAKMTVYGTEDGYCTDVNAINVPCCTFVTKGWAGAYAFFCAIFILLTSMIVMQIKLYTVADTMGQWYFSASATGSASVTGYAQTAGSVRLALRHCLTTSFGSITFAATILTLIRMIRSALQRAARNNIICCIINCFAQPLLALMEKFTRFATIATAITGQAFIPAARTVFDTLKRNFLQTYSMWWVPDFVLGFTVYLLSISWAGLVYFSAYGMNKSTGDAVGIGFATAAVAFLLMLYTLMFVAGLLLDTVNSLYICYALDKDQRRVTHPEIHAIYMQVPGLAVENPDGIIMYGAPVAQPTQAPPPPPPYAGVYPPVQPAATEYAGYPTPAPPAGYPAAAQPAGYPAPAHPAAYYTPTGYNSVPTANTPGHT